MLRQAVSVSASGPLALQLPTEMSRAWGGGDTELADRSIAVTEF